MKINADEWITSRVDNPKLINIKTFGTLCLTLYRETRGIDPEIRGTCFVYCDDADEEILCLAANLTLNINHH
jgi:hypothetical protein